VQYRLGETTAFWWPKTHSQLPHSLQNAILEIICIIKANQFTPKDLQKYIVERIIVVVLQNRELI